MDDTFVSVHTGTEGEHFTTVSHRTDELAFTTAWRPEQLRCCYRGRISGCDVTLPLTLTLTTVVVCLRLGCGGAACGRSRQDLLEAERGRQLRETERQGQRSRSHQILSLRPKNDISNLFIRPSDAQNTSLLIKLNLIIING